VRFVAVDFGRKRIGLAISDATGFLARPWQVIPAAPWPDASAALVASLLVPLIAEDDGLHGIVVGLPRRLDGSDNDMTPDVKKFAAALELATERTVHLQDERLSSVEAEARLAEHEPNWRKRKKLIDAVAAAIVLQDFLDSRVRA
jgi:putative Holliday junction resolvase